METGAPPLAQCTRRAARKATISFRGRLGGYLDEWLGLMDSEPEVVAFLLDGPRVLWPLASAAVKRHTMIGLARQLMHDAPSVAGAGTLDPHLAAASLQGTLSELFRMLQVGVVSGSAAGWKGRLVALFDPAGN
jgi:hypothetical protein